MPEKSAITPIPYGRQQITEEDIEAVSDVLRSDYLTQGPVITQFEEAFADYIGCNYAVAVSNGTAALHLCALALNVNENSSVITSPITFAASANCVKYCGGDVIFADIDPDTWLIDYTKVRKLLISSPKGTFNGIIPVDFAGRAVQMNKFRELADEFGLWIIEDACHAPGGYFAGQNGIKQYCGNGRYADLAIFSFHPVKHIAAGEGGMITTNDESLYQRLLKLRTHGITKNDQEFINPTEIAVGVSQDSHLKAQDYPKWYMEMQELGYNYRLTDFQAALGLSQLSRAEIGLKRRREIAARYAAVFNDKSYIKNHSGVVKGHAYHLYIIEADNREALYNYLRKNGIYTQIHYIPLHLMPYYRQFGWDKGDFPNAESYYSSCISLPMFPALTHEQQEYVIECIQQFYE